MNNSIIRVYDEDGTILMTKGWDRAYKSLLKYANVLKEEAEMILDEDSNAEMINYANDLFYFYNKVIKLKDGTGFRANYYNLVPEVYVEWNEI